MLLCRNYVVGVAMINLADSISYLLVKAPIAYNFPMRLAYLHQRRGLAQ